MAAAYSVLIAALTSLSAGSHTVGSPPTGYKWVVRDIDAYNSTLTSIYGAGGFTLTAASGGDFAGILTPYARYSTVHHLEGRWVIENGDTLEVITQESGWNIRLSGYKLSLP